MTGVTWLMSFTFSLSAQNTNLAPDAPSHPPARPRQPNIICIVADSLGYGDLGCYGQTRIKTPNIDRLAAEGVRFTACYAGSASGVASRASLLTGKHTGHSHVHGEPGDTLQANDITIAEVLTNAGYLTVAYGEWGLGGDATPGAPAKQGFDTWFGYLEATNADNYYPTFLNRFSRGRMTTGPERDVLIPENEGDRKGKYSDDYFTEAALNAIRLFKPVAWTHYRPFFLYLPYTIARPNRALAARTGNGMEIPSADNPYSDQAWPQPEKNKAAMISRLDRYVAGIREALTKLKVDNTIIIFTSANGPAKEGGVDPKFLQSTAAFRGAQGDLYEGGIRVPLIVWWDRRFTAGTVSDVPCALWDLPATMADLSGMAAFEKGDGISLKPALFGQAQTNRHESFYWETREGGFKQAARLADWKGVRTGEGGPLELYNLKVDAAEKTDVAAGNPDVVARLEKVMATARKPAIEGTGPGSK